MYKPEDLLLDFRITSFCNLDCDLCFRNPGIDDQPTSEIFKVIDKMYDLGFRKLGFTGGEPTTRKDFIDLIAYSKNKGFLTYLSTVGHRFSMDHERLNDVLDWVGIPLDGIEKETNVDIRSEKMSTQHHIVKNIFKWLPASRNKIKVKLTTVVTNSNVTKLADMAQWVASLPFKVNAWRFYQFCPLGIGKEKREKLEISKSIFISHMVALKRLYAEMPISWATFEDRDKANIVMEPNFDVIIPDGEEYKLLCNMKSDTKSKILSSIFGDIDIVNKCQKNRFWVY